MANYKGGSMNGSIYVCNLPAGTDENMLAEHFSTIGLLKKDKRTGQPKIWLYRDKSTDEPKGDATVTYEDPHAALAAVEWFNNKEFRGNVIGVHIAESKSKDSFGVENSQVFNDNVVVGDVGGDDGNAGGAGGEVVSGKAWQQDGDWPCPNSSCGNVNFAFRGVCNRCGTARPAGVGGGAGGRGRGRGGGAGGGGRGSGRGGGGREAASGGPTGLFGPNDWSCPMCGNINWAKRMKCNICNTNKPGYNEGGVRGGRGGGYKELDEEELEETKRRRKELEEDDGEMYDEFGNLKKKFRKKAQLPTDVTAHPVPGSGRAGWADEDLGRNSREKSKEKGRDIDERESRKSRERDGQMRERRRSQSRERGERDRERERGREREKDRDYNRERERNRDNHERERERGRDNYERERGRDNYERERNRFRDYR